MGHKKFILILFVLSSLNSFRLARVKYDGGGDWYNDPEILPNLAKAITERTTLKIPPVQDVVTFKDQRIFKYPFLFLTGHGNVNFSPVEVQRVREYVENGGFLYIDDDYGMDEYIRKELKKIFQERELKEIPFSHPIYNIFYQFSDGLPKIHEHYEGPPKAYGIFIKGRLSVLYTYNSNISDGWTDAYNDPEEIREQAIKMGVNIVLYAVLY